LIITFIDKENFDYCCILQNSDRWHARSQPVTFCSGGGDFWRTKNIFEGGSCRVC